MPQLGPLQRELDFSRNGANPPPTSYFSPWMFRGNVTLAFPALLDRAF